MMVSSEVAGRCLAQFLQKLKRAPGWWRRIPFTMGEGVISSKLDTAVNRKAERNDFPALVLLVCVQGWMMRTIFLKCGLVRCHGSSSTLKHEEK